MGGGGGGELQASGHFAWGLWALHVCAVNRGFGPILFKYRFAQQCLLIMIEEWGAFL